MPEKEMGRLEAIIGSMTLKERREPKLMNQSRKERVAKGSGTAVGDVTALLKNFEQMRLMMQRMMGGGGKMPKMGAMPGGRAPMGMPGMPGMAGLAGMAGAKSGSTKRKKKDKRKNKKKR
jgi:signal recognition particle subunit SRP54